MRVIIEDGCYICSQFSDEIEKKSLVLFNPNPYLGDSITVDETWIDHNTTETKQLSKQCVSPIESVQKKAKVGLSPNQVMMTVLWNELNIIDVDCFWEGKKNQLRILLIGPDQ